MSEMIYIGGPYSNNAPVSDGPASAAKRLARFNAVTELARQMIEKEKLIYSPLTMTHPIDIRMLHDPGSDFWVDFDEAFMGHCSSMVVLKLPGWEKSSGLKREIKFFEDLGLPVEYIDPRDVGINSNHPDFSEAFK